MCVYACACVSAWGQLGRLITEGARTFWAEGYPVGKSVLGGSQFFLIASASTVK